MNQNHHHQPPHWASRLLELLIQDVANTPAGDYEEYYSALANSSGLRAARRWYLGQLLRLVPERIGARIYWNMAMWRNYLTVGRRNPLRNRVSSTINLFGLSVAIASCIVVFLFVKDFATIDHFHENAERIFVVNHEAAPDEETLTYGMSPVPLGPAMEESLPQVEAAVRMRRRIVTFSTEELSLRQSVLFVDQAFFDLFTFSLRLGITDALKDQAGVVISNSMATTYFGRKSPLGEMITLSFGDEDLRSFTVLGVAEEFPTNASFTFDVLISADSPEAYPGNSRDDWGQFTDATFILLRKDASIESVESAMNEFVALQNAANEDWQIQNYQLKTCETKA